jgi:hypothetical protein
MMDSITFEVQGATIQLVNGRILIWNEEGDEGLPDIDLPIEVLRRALSAADMLVKK